MESSANFPLPLPLPRGEGEFVVKLRKFSRIILLTALVVLVPSVPASRAEGVLRREIQGDPDLVNQANAPLSSILQLRFRNNYIPRFVDKGGRGNIFSIDITMPLPAYRLLPIRHLTLLSAPVAVTTPDPHGTTGFGDLRFLDLALLHESNKFLFGVGPSFVFPTASERQVGQGKWQVGPAAGFAFLTKRWMMGAIFQNPISFAGDRDRPYANAMLLQPFVTYQIGQGWFVRSQPQMVFDWRTEAKVLPLDLGVGRTFKIGRQDVNCYVQPYWNFSNRGHPPQYGINAGISLLFPEFWKRLAKMQAKS